jgi:ribosomal protein RSM22 (predicted rRNA methylase)
MAPPQTFRCLSPRLVRSLSQRLGLEVGAEAAVPGELAKGVLELSHRFTRERSIIRSYHDDERLRRAYLAYYLPVNLAKVQALLDELPADIWTPSPGRRLRVLDVGCGAGTASLGVLDWVLQKSWTGALDVVAVDQSSDALALCTSLWESYLTVPPAAARLTTVRADLERWRPGKLPPAVQQSRHDLIVAANVLSELFLASREPLTRRAQLVRRLLDLLQPDGTLMILEPALRPTARGLHALRDLLVAEQVCTVYSPCLHERGCPALVNPDDWCHEERGWEAPPLVAAIDRQVGFIKDALKFSYLLLRKDGRTIVKRAPDVYRVVSELREMKGEKRGWLCNESGRPEVGRLDKDRSDTNAAVDGWHRGAIVRISEIVRKNQDGRLGRIPATARVDLIRPVG